MSEYNPFAPPGTDPNAALFQQYRNAGNANWGQGTPPIMTPGQTSGGTPITLPPATPSPDPSAGLVGGAQATSKSLQDYINELTPTQTPLDSQNQAILDRISGLTGQGTGRAQAQIDAENATGATVARKSLQDINNELLTKNADYEKMFANLGGNGAVETSGVLAAQQAGLRRAQAADIGLVTARAQVAQGNLNLALETANRAVDARYQDTEDQIKIAEAQLRAIQPKLTQQQQVQAEARQQMLADQKEKIAEEKAKTKANLELAFTSGVGTKFANKGGEMFRVSDGKPYSSPEEFFRDAGVRSFEEAYQKGFVSDITANKIEDRDFVRKLRDKYGDAGININDDPETAVSKLSQSNLYFKENYIKPEEAAGFPKPISINGQDYFQDPTTGELLPASAFITGGGSDSSAKYVSNNGGALKLNATQVDALSGYDNTKSAANAALDLLNKGTKTGPITGRFLGINKTLGVQDSNQVQLEQQLSALKAEFMKALSGAAVSEPEVKRLSAFLPSITDQESVIKSKLQTIQAESQRKKQSLLDTLNATENSSYNSGNQVKGTSQSIAPLPYISTDNLKPLAQIFPPGSIGGQCGDFVRKLTTKLGGTYPTLGDSLKSKISAVQKYGTSLKNAGIGSVIVTKENPTYGHVAYIIGKNVNGWVVAESNYKQNNEKISYGRTIPFNSSKVVGVINPNSKV